MQLAKSPLQLAFWLQLASFLAPVLFQDVAEYIVDKDTLQANDSTWSSREDDGETSDDDDDDDQERNTSSQLKPILVYPNNDDDGEEIVSVTLSQKKTSRLSLELNDDDFRALTKENTLRNRVSVVSKSSEVRM